MLIDKPRVVDKFRAFHRYIKKNNGQIGIKQRGLDINLRNLCNLKCEHCFTMSPMQLKTNERLDLNTLERIGNQADELGIFELDIQGGEVLLDKKYLYAALKALGTSRFYVYVTTNGFYMNEQVAQDLKTLGVDRCSVSIDSMNPDEHDSFRGKKGSWERAIKALKYVQEAGITPYLNITVGRWNADSDDLRLLLDYSKDNKYTTLINVATPGGMWKEMESICVTEEDTKHLIDLRKEYKNILRNLWDPFDRNREDVIGCNTVNRLYITPSGDVLPCPYIHIKLGNIHEQSLMDISNDGFKIKYFRDNSSKCLAGEDQDFIRNYMAKEGTTIFDPADPKELFNESDFYSDNVITKT